MLVLFSLLEIIPGGPLIKMVNTCGSLWFSLALLSWKAHISDSHVHLNFKTGWTLAGLSFSWGCTFFFAVWRVIYHIFCLCLLSLSCLFVHFCSRSCLYLCHGHANAFPRSSRITSLSNWHAFLLTQHKLSFNMNVYTELL